MSYKRPSADADTSGGFALVSETAQDNDDPVFTKREFSQFDQHLKRRLAGAADTDEISGRSTMLEITAYFCRQRSLSEYERD